MLKWSGFCGCCGILIGLIAILVAPLFSRYLFWDTESLRASKGTCFAYDVIYETKVVLPQVSLISLPTMNEQQVVINGICTLSD